jgi:hypothetical protein
MIENTIISYPEMCQIEGTSLQAGMNFGLGGTYSVILMSTRPNSPYRDEVLENGTVLIYEGHDAPRVDGVRDTKQIDQPEFSARGTLTQNGKFFKAAKQFQLGTRPPELVKVYEKIKSGIWSDNGFFNLVDAFIESDGPRNVFKFKLVASQAQVPGAKPRIFYDAIPRRIIPTKVKLEVWKRDKGKCVECGSENELHFDHIIPFSKGGTSVKPENIQLLCARHNISKRDNIV